MTEERATYNLSDQERRIQNLERIEEPEPSVKLSEAQCIELLAQIANKYPYLVIHAAQRQIEKGRMLDEKQAREMIESIQVLYPDL